MSNLCMKCGTLLNDGAKFCAVCGEPVQVPPKKAFCMNCGTELNAGAQFCVKCGTRAGEAPTVHMKPVQVNVCINCKEPMRSDSKFCLKCGTPVGQGVQQIRQAQPVMQQAGAMQNAPGQQQASPIQDVQCTVNTIRDAAGKIKHIFEKNVAAADFAGEMRIPIGNTGDGQMMGFIRNILK